MPSCPKTRFEGFSLTELLIVLTIVFIISLIALLQIQSSRNNLQMQNVSSELKTHLERARFDSVKRNASDANEKANITINDATSFSVRTDLNQNGVLDTNEKRDIDFSYQDQIKFFGDNLVFPVVISFNNRGQTIATDGDGNIITPNFLVCRKNCAEISTNPSSFQIVAVSPTGTVTVLNGDEMLETATPPSNVSTSTTSGVQPLATTIPSDGSVIDVVLGN